MNRKVNTILSPFLATEQRLVHRLIAWEFKNKGLALWALAGAVGSYRAGAGGRCGLTDSKGN